LSRFLSNSPTNATDPSGLVIYALTRAKLGDVLEKYVGKNGFTASQSTTSGWCVFFNNQGPDLLNIAGSWGGDLNVEIVGGMLAEGRTFKIYGVRAGEKLKTHVAERASVVSYVKASTITFGTTNDANPKVWDKNLDAIGYASEAVLDVLGTSYEYTLGCHDAIYLLMLGGIVKAHTDQQYVNWFDKTVGKNPIGNKNLVLDVHSAAKGNWIPGDRGYITNTDLRSNKSAGLEGHNMVYVGGGYFADAFGGRLMTLDEAVEYVRTYDPKLNNVSDPRVEDTRRFPTLRAPLPY
jgi:hypothetical protein